MSQQTHSCSLRIRVDLSTGDSLTLPQIALLERIETYGSLSQAAPELKVSYRYAWLLLESLNRSFVVTWPNCGVVLSNAGEP